MSDQTPEDCKICALFCDSRNFCATLSPPELVSLNAKSQTATFKRGQTIHDDLIARWPIFVIESGVMSLQHLLNDGRKTIAAFYTRGDVVDMRNSSNRKVGHLVALSKLKVCKLSPRIFENIVHSNPRARTVIWDSLRDQAFRSIDHSSDLAKKQALEKLASFIFECRHRNPGKYKKDHVEIPVRRLDLAEYLGMQPETVSRCYKILEDQKIIKVSDLSLIHILDTPALRQIANGTRADQTITAGDRVNLKMRSAG